MGKRFMFCLCLVFAVLSLSIGGGESRLEGSAPSPKAQWAPTPTSIPRIPSKVEIDADYGRMPVYFIPNQGQMDHQVAYYVQGNDKSLYFTEKGITIALAEQGLKEAAPERWAVKLDFVGAAKGVKPVGEDETGAVVSYFKGKQKDWKAGLPTYSRIVYRDLWPGIDLVYHGTVNKLKYEFVVHPGADPSKIRLAYRGADNLAVDEAGRLTVKTPAGSFQDDVPVAYQERDGKQIDVGLAYALEPGGPARLSAARNQAEQDAFRHDDCSSSAETGHAYGFKIGDYDRSLPLILDPAFLIRCGFIGGSYHDYASGIAIDSAGNVYVTGVTDSTEATFPAAVGPDLTYGGGYHDAFVAKVSPSGIALVYCGYIGGSGDEDGAFGIAVDGTGNAYVTGATKSNETSGPGGGFPVRVGPDLTYNGATTLLDYGDAFVAKVNPAGTALVYCGFIGGSGDDVAFGIAVDSTGSAYVTGETLSTEATFPVVMGPDLTYNGATTSQDYRDAFVAKVNPAGTALVYCGYIGGSGFDFAGGIAVDSAGSAYVTGETLSTEATFPVVMGPDLTYNGSYDTFVAKVNSSGSALIYCGYIGGFLGEAGRGIAIDSAGNAYITGHTNSTEETFPVVSGPDLTFNGLVSSFDAFVAKVNPAGTALVYCGYIGGDSRDSGSGIAVDSSGNAYVTGITQSREATFPVAVGPDLTHNGGDDAFVAKICYFDERIRKHAVGDFDGDGTDEIAVDFGSTGAWIWDSGNWTVLTVLNPESMIAADVNGDGADEIFLSFYPGGLWVVAGGVGHGISSRHVDNMAAGDIDADGHAELVCDFGDDGIWGSYDGVWLQLSGVNPDYLTVDNIDFAQGDEIIADFGPLGLWRCMFGAWQPLSALDPDYLTTGKTAPPKVILGDFGRAGLWMYRFGVIGWTQLTGANPDYVMSVALDSTATGQVVADFGAMGLWFWDKGTWTQLSNRDAIYMVSADVDGNGKPEIVVDFGSAGLWLSDTTAWSELSGAIAEYLIPGDFDGDAKDEILVDFGALGLWMWNEGAWTQMSAENPLPSGTLD